MRLNTLRRGSRRRGRPHRPTMGCPNTRTGPGSSKRDLRRRDRRSSARWTCRSSPRRRRTPDPRGSPRPRDTPQHRPPPPGPRSTDPWNRSPSRCRPRCRHRRHLRSPRERERPRFRHTPASRASTGRSAMPRATERRASIVVRASPGPWDTPRQRTGSFGRRVPRCADSVRVGEVREDRGGGPGRA